MRKTALTTGLQIVMLCFLVVAYNNLVNSLPVSVKLKENVVIQEIKQDLVILKAPKKEVQELTNAVYIAHQSTGISHKLITSLMCTESNFDKNAIGPDNRTGIRYKGLLQTPIATFRFSDVDTLHGARILKEKLEITDYDLRRALALYKGGDNPMALRQADEIIKLYRKLQRIV